MGNNCWLSGKTVIVTGASGGMGAGIAKTLIIQHGCRVIGIARNETKIKKFIDDELGDKYRDNFTYRLFDVSKKENWENFADELRSENAKIDILINNAGILPKFKSFDKYSEEELENAMNINFYSCLYSIKALLPFILQSQTPAIINIDSASALMTLAGTSIYSASKAALKSLTEALREEYRGKIYVGLVCPGFTKTGIFRNQGTEENRADMKIMDMISTDCDKMVAKIMSGIRHKKAMQVHGFDTHSMSLFNRIMPVNGSRLFCTVMKNAKADIFKDVYN
ncbi:MAG: SDR family NAD(P)-dependent oxidoreductase [Eubacterium sp.]|nr:SDR family NAD(P)-dependent oxidoreductase [Eubacterium sp.]